jgi:hypothetical protein
MEMYFREDQRFRGPWIWTAIAIDLVVTAIVCGAILYRSGQEDARAAIYATGLIIIAVNAGVIALLLITKLQIEVSRQGIFVRLYPFQRRVRKIDLDGVTGARLVSFRPIRDYGGYGLRVRRDGKAYIVQGEQGVRLDYANGYHILIAARNAEVLHEAVLRILPLDRPGGPAATHSEEV